MGTMATKRILLIDNEPGTHLVVQVTLKVTLSWETLVADSYQNGIALAAAEQPDAILLDVMMLELEGVSDLKHMETNAFTRNIPTILLIPKAQANSHNSLSQSAIAGIITKPFKPTELVQQVCSILGRYD
jgi:CheY-like chemotaxis protein